MLDLGQTVKGIEFSKVARIKRGGKGAGSKDEKRVEITVKFEDVSLNDVFEGAVAQQVIKWQNNNRKYFDSIKPGEKVVIKFREKFNSGKIDVETAMANKLAAMSKEERQLYVEEMLKKLNERA